MDNTTSSIFDGIPMSKGNSQNRVFDARLDIHSHQKEPPMYRRAQESLHPLSSFDDHRPSVTNGSNYQIEQKLQSQPICDNFLAEWSLKRDFENYILKFGNNLYQTKDRHLKSPSDHQRHTRQHTITKPVDFFAAEPHSPNKLALGVSEELGSLSPISLSGSPYESPHAGEVTQDSFYPSESVYESICDDTRFVCRAPTFETQYQSDNLHNTSQNNSNAWPRYNGRFYLNQSGSMEYENKIHPKSLLDRGKSGHDYCTTIRAPLTRPIMAAEYPIDYNMLSPPTGQSFSNETSTIPENNVTITDDYKEISQYFDFSDTTPQPICDIRSFGPEYDSRMNIVQRSPPYSPSMEDVPGGVVMIEDFKLPPVLPISPLCVKSPLKGQPVTDTTNNGRENKLLESLSTPDGTCAIHCASARVNDIGNSKLDSRRILTSTDVNGSVAYICSDCGAQFRVRGYLVRHMRKHAKVMRFRCPLHALLPDDAKCHSSGGFSRGDTYKMHMKARHFIYPKCTPRKCRIQSTGTCGGCGNEFENNDVWFKEHIKGKKCPQIWGNQSLNDGTSFSKKPHVLRENSVSA